ncbi:MAG TPA: cation:proton antiporter [Candidatus Eisenbacteria bacterium]|nr:cation:proton antiporter [Candidatus Eisenbacteria bacterium]
MSNFDLVLKLFFQLAVILAVCRLVGLVGSRLGQAQVVCEMVAGVLLGPSLLGLVAPQAQAWLFPKASMPVLYAISQVGLVLYMFMIGLEFDVGLILGRVRGAVLVSWTGVTVPLILGMLAGVALRDDADLFAPEVSVMTGALYLGAAMSITAFPMLARIIHEKGIARTRLGTLTLAAGASDDALAWCLLAVVLSQIEGSAATAVKTIAGAALYCVFMLTIGRRLLVPLGRRVQRDGGLTPPTMVTALFVLMLSAWATDAIGIYAVFGAFIAGVAMPRGAFAREVTAHVDLLTTTFFLPVFFVYSGLNTRIGLLDSAHLWGIALLVLAIAVAGKGLACLAAARAAGEAWREAITIGVLMNARGLMELIILNIGLERGVITPTLFTIMVVMALVTTLMASPLFELLYGRHVVAVGAPARAG